MLKLSIIVPIYNVEPYLRKCVDSLLAQDLPKDEYEIILVDDGSPDGCPAICDEYAQTLHPSDGSRKGANIRVLHQPNGGLSAARNSGLKVAQGKYVQFVDSDDYLESNVLGGLVAQMEREDLDVLRFDFQNVRLIGGKEINEEHDGHYHSPNTKVYEVFEPYKQHHFFDTRTDTTDGITYLNERMGYQCYATNYIIRREMLADIIFTEGIHFEDVDWTPRMLLAAKRVNSTQTIVYDYLLRKGSITGTTNMAGKRRNLEDSLRVVERLGALYAQYPQCSWLKNMQSNMVSGNLCTVASCFYSERKAYVRRIRQMHVLPLRIANQGTTYVRRARLINFCPEVFLLIMNLRHRL